jgi:hypothetical protein
MTKSYEKTSEFLPGVKNQYANKLQFLVKNSAEIWERIKPDHHPIFLSLAFLCKQKNSIRNA